MNEYRLFNQTISFDTGSMRYWKNMNTMTIAMEFAETLFASWYEEQPDIKAVINNYPKFASGVVVDLVLNPSFEDLPEYEIYDVTKRSYNELCIDYSGIEEAYADVTEQYDAILESAEEMRRYREIRKESRAQFVGGGFGIGGAIRGSIKAGIMNAATGMVHSVRNVVGNTGTAIGKRLSIRALYRNDEIALTLWSGLRSSMIACNFRHLKLVNSRFENTFVDSFETERAEALFQNAKKIPDKAKRLLVDAFSACPYDKEMYCYAFINYPDARHDLIKLGTDFDIDFGDIIELALTAEYPNPGKTEEEDLRIKKILLSMMKEYGVETSTTLNALEYNCLTRIIDEEGGVTPSAVERIKNYDALATNKQIIIKQQKIWQLSKEFDVAFNAEEIEEILAEVCAGRLLNDPKRCLRVKEDVNLILRSIIVTDDFKKEESKAYSALEKQQLTCLFGDPSSIPDIPSCRSMLEAIERFDALPSNKDLFADAFYKRLDELNKEADENVACLHIFESQLRDMCVSDLKRLNERVQKSTLSDTEKKEMVSQICARQEQVPMLLESMKDVLQIVCGTIVNKAGIADKFFVVGGASFEKKLPNATGEYASLGGEEIALMLYDDTLFGNAKAGFVVTNKQVFAKPLMEKAFILDIQAITCVEEVGKQVFIRTSKRKELLAHAEDAKVASVLANTLESIINIIKETSISSIEDKLNKTNRPPADESLEESKEEQTTNTDTQHTESENAATQEGEEQNRDVQISKELVTALVNQYNLGARYLLTGTSSFEKKVAKAKANFATIPSDEIPLFLEDLTLLGSCKEGVVVTDKALYMNYAGARGMLPLNHVVSVDATYERKVKMYYLNLCFPNSKGDGSLAKVIISFCSGETDMGKLVSFWRDLLKLN